MTESQTEMLEDQDELEEELELEVEMSDEEEEVCLEPLANHADEIPCGPLIDRLVDAERQCTEAEREAENAKAKHKASKVHYEACCLRLRQLVREIRNDENRPLLKQMEASEAAEAWREAPITDLAISDGVLKKLAEANVHTIGSLEDLRAKISNGRAVWPKGIGEAKISQIEDAIVQWLAVHEEAQR